jgi:16S rRNA (cytosine967-C5)-methyltransferase
LGRNRRASARTARLSERAKPDARAIAARVLERVDKDRAYAAAALSADLERHPQLDARERALATELCYGVLRTRATLLKCLERQSQKGLGNVDPLTMAHLSIATYQLLFLDRIPAFAAVDSAVTQVRRSRGPGLAGFANAVLRRVASTRERPSRDEAVLESIPGWLLSRLTSALGEDEARALVGAGDAGVPPIGVRVVAERRAPEWLEQAERGRVSPLCRLVRAHGNPRRLPGYEEGAFVIQEEGAQLVTLALGARPGERVLDACAGRGQKTSLLVERVGRDGAVFATDCYPKKLALLETEFERLRLPLPTLHAVDWTVGPGPVPDHFDRVLVDAPCTGVGTGRRRPEIFGRLQPEDPERISGVAASILRNAALRARPGGRVVFAVCSVLPEECERVLAEVTDELEPAAFDAPELVGFLAPEQTSFRLLPGLHGTDGFFVASFKRRE